MGTHPIFESDFDCLTEKMVFYLIGLGLSSPEDISLKGLKAIKTCSRVYLEMYTAILMAQKEGIEEVYEKKVILADREMVESESDILLENAQNENVAFLVVGDVFGETISMCFWEDNWKPDRNWTRQKV